MPSQGLCWPRHIRLRCWRNIQSNRRGKRRDFDDDLSWQNSVNRSTFMLEKTDFLLTSNIVLRKMGLHRYQQLGCFSLF